MHLNTQGLSLIETRLLLGPVFPGFFYGFGARWKWRSGARARSAPKFILRTQYNRSRGEVCFKGRDRARIGCAESTIRKMLLRPVSFDTPAWAGSLTHCYWRIRVEGRDKAKRRRYYRYVAKEKLRLAEQGHDQELIKAVCRYLCRMDKASGSRMQELMQETRPQLAFEFHFR